VLTCAKTGGAGSWNGTVKSWGATVRLEASNQLGDAQQLRFESVDGNLFDTQGYSETLGKFALTKSGSIDFGSGDTDIAFDASDSVLWGGAELDILNFDAASGDTLRFGTTSGGLSAAQLDVIVFDGKGPASIDAAGYVWPPPPQGTLVTIR
jgi:hypothetical protein